MVDIFSKEKRSQIMSKVSGKETKPEILVRKLLFSKGFRYRKNVKSLPGNPDIVLPKYKTVIFVHGCFWHQHEGCRKSIRPTTKIEFWNEKLDKNIVRDTTNVEHLTKAGWKVLTVWECQLKKKDIETLTQEVISQIIQ
jgi:DNA mismatch endonuclease (patch repair protein)